MDFSEIMTKLIEGYKVTRVGWNNEKIYLVLEGEIIRIIKEGVTHDWVIQKEDMVATDWSII